MDAKQKSIEKRINEISEAIEQRHEQSNGFLNKSGGHYSNAEGHAVFIGLSTVGLAYVFPHPLGEFVVIAWLLLLRTIYKNLGDLEGHMKDIAHEYAYMISAAFVTAVFFDRFTDYSLQTIEVGELIARLLLGV